VAQERSGFEDRSQREDRFLFILLHKLLGICTELS
jgi:hypothetical protein